MPPSTTTDGNASQSERPVDGVTTGAVATPPKKEESAVRFTKRFVVIMGTILYSALMIWCFVLLAILPSPTGEMHTLVSLGILTSLCGAAVFVIVGLLLVQRIAKADVPIATRQRSLIKLILTLLPGIVVCVIVPFMILREPPLSIQTIPSDSRAFVAPLSLTLSVEKAVATLKNLGLVPVQYVWDTDGDGKSNDTTVVPTVTVVYDRSGVYNVAVRIVLNGGASRLVNLRIIIGSEVFSVKPIKPIVEKPARFSVEGLLADPKLLQSVQWDFEGNGTTEESKTPYVTHTYYATGTYHVTAVMLLTNKTQKTYKRDVEVVNPPPLPFPITLRTDPANLVGPSPFGVLFTLQTQEPLKDVVWSFGDGKQEEGSELKRIGHSFEVPGIYAVEVQARSQSGSLADITVIVRATSKLTLSDLHFEGTPDVKSNTITGDTPLSVQIKPVTSQPLIQFLWEAPDQDNATITDSTFQAVYREAGTYNVTLVGQGPDGSSMRLPLKVTVNAPGTESAFSMKPESGSAPLHVQFDASDAYVPVGEDIAGFKWEFGDEPLGQKVNLGGSKTDHTFAKEGEYKVTMTIVTLTGKEYPTQRTIVVLPPSNSVCLTASRTTVVAGKAVAFDSSCSTGDFSSILWDVRSVADPQTVIEQSADAQYIHVFDKEGTYTVTLTEQNANGYTASKSVTITVTP